MIEPLRHFSLGCAKGSKHGVESLAGELRRGAPLKTAARNLKPNTDDDICRQLHVLYAQSSLGERLGKIRLEIFTNAQDEPSWSLRASDHKPRPEGVIEGLLQKLREG
jgi:hypothetical protein